MRTIHGGHSPGTYYGLERVREYNTEFVAALGRMMGETRAERAEQTLAGIAEMESGSLEVFQAFIQRMGEEAIHHSFRRPDRENLSSLSGYLWRTPEMIVASEYDGFSQFMIRYQLEDHNLLLFNFRVPNSGGVPFVRTTPGNERITLSAMLIGASDFGPVQLREANLAAHAAREDVQLSLRLNRALNGTYSRFGSETWERSIDFGAEFNFDGSHTNTISLTINPGPGGLGGRYERSLALFVSRLGQYLESGLSTF